MAVFDSRDPGFKFYGGDSSIVVGYFVPDFGNISGKALSLADGKFFGTGVQKADEEVEINYWGKGWGVGRQTVQTRWVSIRT